MYSLIQANATISGIALFGVAVTFFLLTIVSPWIVYTAAFFIVALISWAAYYATGGIGPFLSGLLILFAILALLKIIYQACCCFFGYDKNCDKKKKNKRKDDYCPTKSIPVSRGRM